MARKLILPFLFIATPFLMFLNAQDSGYKAPPKVIQDLVDVPPTPGVSISPTNDWILLMERPSHPSIEEVAQPELRLAGIRINPRTNGPSRTRSFVGLKLLNVKNQKQVDVDHLPENPRIGNLSWNNDGSKVAFTNTTGAGIELWLLDIKTAKAEKLLGNVVNGVMRGNPFNWLDNGNKLLVRTIPANRGEMPEKASTPSGPVIQENAGAAAPVRTYQDLLQNQHDVQVFDYFAKSEVKVLDLSTKELTDIGIKGAITSLSTSPDGNYLFVSKLEKPYSYMVPYSRFPTDYSVYDKTGKLVRQIAMIPLAENIPKGFGAVREGPRNFAWRADAPATLYWVEAKDGGDPKKKTDVRDRLYTLDAPFDKSATAGIDFKLRYGGVSWGNDNLAIAYENWFSTRQQITSTFNPSSAKGSKKVLFDRSTEDRYNDPGRFLTADNRYGRRVLQISDDKKLYTAGLGASPKGNQPFVHEFDLASKKTKVLWKSKSPYYESPITTFDDMQKILIVRESKEDPPTIS